MSAFRKALRLSVGLLMAVGLALPAPAQAASLGKIGYGGSGCPGGSASVSLSGNSLSLRFTQFRATAGGKDTFGRVSCNLAIPLRVPAGLSVSIASVSYRGTSSLPSGASGVLSTELFVTGGQGPIISRSFKGPSSGRFASTVSTMAPVWSACGADVNLRVNSSLRVTTSGGRSASLSVRSQEVSSALVYVLKWRSC
jgi:hypothetical protein